MKHRLFYTRNKALWILLTSVFFVFVLCGCSRHPKISRSALAFDTVVTISLYDTSDQNILDAAFKTIDEADQALNAFSPDSQIGKINTSAGIASVKVDESLYNTIKKTMIFSELSEGGFDVTAGALIDLWGIGEVEEKEPPNAAAVQNALALTGYQKMILNDSDHSVYLPEKGMKINLGAVAKGAVADRLKADLIKAGVKNGILNLGGSVTLIGGKSNRQDFSVGVNDPKAPDQKTIGVLSLRDTSVVSSGDYERYFTDASGKRWHHILDARTGYPADNDLCQVTVVDADTTKADILSTALFIMGSEKAMSYLKNEPDIEGILVKKDGTVLISSGLKDQFQTENKNDYRFTYF